MPFWPDCYSLQSKNNHNRKDVDWVGTVVDSRGRYDRVAQRSAASGSRTASGGMHDDGHGHNQGHASRKSCERPKYNVVPPRESTLDRTPASRPRDPPLRPVGHAPASSPSVTVPRAQRQWRARPYRRRRPRISPHTTPHVAIVTDNGSAFPGCTRHGVWRATSSRVECWTSCSCYRR